MDVQLEVGKQGASAATRSSNVDVGYLQLCFHLPFSQQWKCSDQYFFPLTEFPYAEPGQ
jgi:hypothetical protein